MTIHLRKATTDDVAACVALVQAERERLEAYEPLFWRRAQGAERPTAAWLAHLARDAEMLFLVAVEEEAIAGFLVSRFYASPPVFDPGGLTAMIDDFCVADIERWTDIGGALLREVRRLLRDRGVAQVIVACPTKDDAKLALLQASDLSPASTWWTAAP
jgi:GNAT superfamily N-acetyltransferase